MAFLIVGNDSHFKKHLTLEKQAAVSPPPSTAQESPTSAPDIVKSVPHPWQGESNFALPKAGLTSRSQDEEAVAQKFHGSPRLRQLLVSQKRYRQVTKTNGGF